MFNRIAVLIGKDFRNGLRDNIFLYALLAPLILALLMRFFLPVLSANSFDVVLLEQDKNSMSPIQELAQVEYVDTSEEMKERVLRWDDAVGIIAEKQEGKSFTIIAEGNEDKAVLELAGAVTNKLSGSLEGAQVGQINLNKPKQPVYMMTAILLCIFPLMIGGMLTGFALTEEKEFKTRQALYVTPLTNVEYLMGKTLLGMGIAFIMVVLIILILGIEVNWLQLLLITLGGVFLSTLFGIMIGAISNNQLTALANTKIGSMFFIVIPLITVFIPRSKEYFLYWVPTYWTFAGYRSIFWESGTWGELLPIFGWNMTINLVFLVLAYWGIKKYESRA
ncbi:MAG: ABC transporter permease [Bacillota bacterium]